MFRVRPTTPKRVSPSKNRRRSNGRRVSIPLRRPVCPASLPTPSKNHAACSNIKVMLRVRPANGREVEDERYRDVVEVVDKNYVIFDPKEEEEPFFHRGQKQTYRDITKPKRKHMQFNFDSVFGPEETTQEVYESSIKTLIPNLLSGYNCTVFAYGATGAGKTHTMLGSEDVAGITPLLMFELYKQLESLEYADIKIQVSYLEIYNEMVHDLLVEKSQVKNLELREDGIKVAVPGLSWLCPSSADDLMALLHLGNRRRTQHPTDANAESSRSHAVFQVVLTMKQQGQVRCAKLSMIDLAGSERAAATKNNKCRFKEGANINKSLLALGNCINSLADGLKHIPFRDSNLTRLLKGSLGGNCCTVMIANVSPSSLTYEDTYNTLKYATRAKKIKNKVKKNSVSVNLTTREYTRVIEAAQAEIASLRAEKTQLEVQLQSTTTTLNARIEELEAEKTMGGGVPIAYSQDDTTDLHHRLATLEAENRALRCGAELSHNTDDVTLLKTKVLELETELSVLKATPPPTPPDKSEMQIAPPADVISSSENLVTSLLEELRLLQVADIGLKKALDAKYQLTAQLKSLEYNFKKKIDKIEKVNCLKKDSTETKISSLISKTEVQRTSLQNRLKAAEEVELDAKTLFSDALLDFKKAAECVSVELTDAIMPFMSASANVYELKKQVEISKTICATYETDLSSLHSVWMQLADISYTMRCVLIALKSISPDMEQTYEKIITTIRQSGNVTFQEPIKEEQSKEPEDTEELAQPLNATFCVPATSTCHPSTSVNPEPPAPAKLSNVHRTLIPPTSKTSGFPSVFIKKLSSAPVEVTNMRVSPATLNPPPSKMSRLAAPSVKQTPEEAGSASAAKVARRVSPIIRSTPSARVSLARPGSSAGRRRRTPLRNNFKKFKKPFAVKPINYNKENSNR